MGNHNFQREWPSEITNNLSSEAVFLQRSRHYFKIFIKILLYKMYPYLTNRDVVVGFSIFFFIMIFISLLLAVILTSIIFVILPLPQQPDPNDEEKYVTNRSRVAGLFLALTAFLFIILTFWFSTFVLGTAFIIG